VSDSEEGDDEPTVPVVCEACGTTTRIALSEVGEAVERHNEQLHDGDDVAEIDPEIKRQLTNMIAEDMGL
jgi:hypothetical protein